MKQTAVEWLVQQICGEHTEAWQQEIQIAKEMEKEQIIVAYERAMETDIYNEPLKIGKDYFNETYKSE